MVTGARPFTGDTPASVIGAILKDQPPPISARQPLAPPALDRMVSACLAKDAEERWQSAHDLKLELLSIRPEVPVVYHAPRSLARWLLTAAGALVLLALGAIGTWAMRGGSSPDGLLIQHATRLTNETGFSEWPTWSPDGKLFAYSSNQNRQLSRFTFAGSVPVRTSMSAVMSQTTCSRRFRPMECRSRSCLHARPAPA